MVEHPTTGELESATSAKENYKVLISEAYIKPIRSAIIVDDDYISFESLIKRDIDSQSQAEKSPRQTYEKLFEVIEACKASPRNWLVDVHDASNIGKSQYGNLHQSDLMILDFHLEKNSDDGTKALEVLRSLANSMYFNLVIVYTNCKDDSELDGRVVEVASSLIFHESPLGKLESTSAPEELVDWENDDINVAKQLDSLLSTETFLNFFQESGIDKWEKCRGFEKIKALTDARSKSLHKSIGPKNIIEWLMANRKSKFKGKFSECNYGKVDFSIGKTNWIRTNNLFVTIVPKSIKPLELQEKLLAALEESKPSPHQLIMTKIRNVMDEKGVSAERNVLRKEHLQAYWLKEMLLASDRKRSWQLKQTIRHHWDELASEVNQDVVEYGEKLFQLIQQEDSFNANGFIEKHTSLDMTVSEVEKRVMEEWNSFVCNRPVDELHLMTGHIFKLSRGGVDEHWICLSPACDLVPAQKSKWGSKDIEHSKLLPFKAAQLFDRTNADAMKSATKSDEYIFLKSENKIQCFSYLPASNGNPVWEQFFAHDNGYIQDKAFTASAISIDNSEEINIGFSELQATIVAQLRNEYALNLLQKLGGSLSRIGLDFVSYPK